MRKASFLHALVVLSACGSGGHGMPLVDGGDTAGDAGDMGGMMDAGFRHCSRVMYSTASPLSYPTGLTPNSVAVRDVNKDGKPDLVTANGDGSSISVLLGNGDGTFKAKSDIPTDAGPTAVTVVDVNKDGIPDVIVANKGPRTVSVLLGNGDGTFTAKLPISISSLPVALAVADVNGDTRLDIFVVVDSGSDIASSMTVLIGSGDGTFTAKSPDIPTGGHPGAIAVADVDKDGKPDILVSSGTDSTVSLFRGKGDGTFTFQIDDAYILGTPGMVVPAAVALVDVSGDGQLDIVGADNTANQAFVLLNMGGGMFRDPDPHLVGAAPQALAVADITGDGQLDIVTVDLVAQAISVLAGHGDGTFEAKVDSVVGDMPAALAVADLNGDLVPDIVVGDQGTHMALVILGQCQP